MVEDVIASDAALIRRCRGGEVNAFGDLVARYQDRLYGTLVHILGSTEDARDAVQEAFVLAYQKLATFRGDAAFYSWLFRIAYNAAMTQRRKERRASRDTSHFVNDRGGSDVTDQRPGSSPSYALETEERQALVRHALTELAEEYRTALVLKEIDGLRYEEIAEIVDCPIGTVRSRIHRARQELRDKLSRAIRNEV